MEHVTKETYNFVRTRDRNRCVLCHRHGDYYQLHLHHIHSRGKQLTNDVNNCVMLCVDCHKYKAHGNSKKYSKILDEYIRKVNNVKIE